MKRCKARTNSGDVCRARPRADGYCNFHGNPGVARDLGAKGGRANRRRVLEPIVLPDGISVYELRQKTLEVMRLIFTGQITSHEAMAFVQLSRQYERLLGVAEKQDEVEILKQQVAEMSETPSNRSKPSPENRQGEECTKIGQAAGGDMSREVADPQPPSTGPKRSEPNC